MRYTHVARRLLRTLAIGPIVALVTTVVYDSHGKALTAGLIDLVLVMLIAFRWGFIDAAVASVLSVGCLDYFYMVPIFSLYAREPQDWISSGIFVAIALAAGHFADRIKQKAAQTESERTRLERLYLTSRDIIIMDRSKEVGAQLTHLIADTFKVDAVALWDAREVRMDKAGKEAIPDDEVRATYFHELCENDFSACRFKRVLRLGTRPVGALYIKGSHLESHLDPRSVDAIASLSAIALERAHSFIAESNAEAAKRSEQLRTAVLDGLAHAFKTPLATIQSASSGLLEISNLEYAERELVSLIDEETTRLAKLTNQILQTAKLDEGQLEVDHEKIYLTELVELYKEQYANRLEDHPLSIVHEVGRYYLWADARMLQMALFQLLDNASKYASPKSRITFRIASTDTEVVFSVQNEGSFIAPEERLRIFQRFYRAPGSQYKASGTGIGLSVTKRIVEAHRGRVWVESDPEAITTFFLALPHVRMEV
ncbi:sensor histidine kinase [Edaphobacter modestus]|uniref:histidine kinase n=1 Tax=Edaphobacter modestus TaxID=388466 RepID=A0A4Q7YS79_9BACT|nr:ATP-binding protein [Edaphobacter modestus]RZU39783.1 two-component system sensor histidine kinase KdpD [Edaphobacter modestus]